MAYQEPANDTPSTCTKEIFDAAQKAFLDNLVPKFTLELLQNNDWCYGAVINTSLDGVPLKQIVGTANAKMITNAVLNTALGNFLDITTK